MATVDLWSARFKKWVSYSMIVDTGADYTLLPLSDAADLGVDLEKDCRSFATRGIGGTETVYLLRRRMKAKIGDFTRNIPIGFLARSRELVLTVGEICLYQM